MADVQVANCPNPECRSAILASHPYPWCTECGERFTEEIQARLPRLQEGKTQAGKVLEELRSSDSVEARPLVVLGQPLRCMVCKHDLFIRHEADPDTTFALVVARSDGVRYVCARCGYVHGFGAEPPREAPAEPDRRNDVRIRLARESEQKSLEGLQLRASLGNPGDREALLANPDAIELPLEQVRYGQVFVAEAGDSVLGFAAILPREDGDVELDGLFVEPDLWRRGVGRKLVDHCSQEARLLGADSLHVIGHPDAEGFYTACGFELMGTTQTRFGPALLMCRRL